MLIRIFGEDTHGLGTAMKFLSLKMHTKGGAEWLIENCDPVTWGNRTGPADLHIYIGVPCRIAFPWAAYNIVIVDDASWSPDWNWCFDEKSGVDMFVVGEGSPAAKDKRRFVLTYENRKEYYRGWEAIVGRALRDKHMPALPTQLPKGSAMPKVGLVTVTRNRPEWWSNMVCNVMNVLRSWPLNRVEWLIVDDSDADKRIGERVAKLQADLPALMVKYIELDTVATVGAKRNMAVEAAAADTDVFACMDDDDHYPPGSLERRVPWLQIKGAAYCSAIPMYDITRYISAMNVPPLSLGASQRISEATLTFTRKFWAERGFPDVSMAEGEGFLIGRESGSAEIPPYGVIVSFIHKNNSSSRRTPPAQEPNGSHYGFSDQYFEYLQEIGGVNE